MQRRAAIAMLVLALAALLPRIAAASLTERSIVVRAGDTLAGVLSGAGAEAGEIEGALAALRPLFRPRGLRPGDEIAIRLDPARDDALVELEIEPEPGRSIVARLRDGRWTAEEEREPQQRFLSVATGGVEGGLLPAMTAAGLPPALALALIRTLGHRVDFQRDLRPGDRFTVLFERFRDGQGGLLRHGRVLQVELVLSNRRLAWWRHETASGSDWFDEAGEGLRRAFLRTPLDGARVSSGFGMRAHPARGFTRMHRGMDFAAPSGTPVYAAADGTVAAARTMRGYGRIVALRHGDGTETRYAHLSRFARGLAAGRRVRQGDVIGRVGSTGLSTGPHLHYEVLVGGRHTDPAQHRAEATRLAAAELQEFQAARQRLAAQVAAMGQRTEMAMAE